MLVRLNLTEIDNMIAHNPKISARDMTSNVLSLNDVVKCSSYSIYKNKKGVIKNMCRNCLFLQDPKDFLQQNGMFVEKAINVTILGNEFLQGDVDNKAVALQNRIIRDKMVGKQVQITKGVLKGQRGVVVKINGDDAIIELLTKCKKVSIPKENIIQLDTEGDDEYGQSSQFNERREQRTGGQSQYGTKGAFGGGNSVYGGASMYGGQTAQYEAGKTPMAFTPMYAAQTPAADRTQTDNTTQHNGSQWGYNTQANQAGKYSSIIFNLILFLFQSIQNKVVKLTQPITILPTTLDSKSLKAKVKIMLRNGVEILPRPI